MRIKLLKRLPEGKQPLSVASFRFYRSQAGKRRVENPKGLSAKPAAHDHWKDAESKKRAALDDAMARSRMKSPAQLCDPFRRRRFSL
jgi:hypothetical protein